MKTGILGGTFDPIHNGHLQMAVRAQQQYHLDRVWLMPGGHTPHKKEEDITPAQHRRAMAELAARPYPFLSVSTLEMDSEERSYTYRTLQKLHSQYPEDEFYFIMGADSLDYLDKWVHPEIICELSVILAAGRGERDEEQMRRKAEQIQKLFPADIRMIHGVQNPAASRNIRALIARQDAASEIELMELLPEEVLTYVKRYHLYT